MGFRLAPITSTSLHEGLATRANHLVAVTGAHAELLVVCPELAVHAAVDGSGVSWLPYWLVALRRVARGPETTA